MRALSKVRLRLRSLFRRPRLEDELDAELRFHLDQQIEENLASGMALHEAHSAALRTIGGITQFQEECRDMRRVNLIQDLAQDLRYGIRTLRKSPVFTCVAVLSLALGIGVNTTIFSLVNAFALRPLPVQKPQELVFIGAQPEPGNTAGFSYPLFEAVRDHNQTLAGVFVTTDGGMNVVVDGESELARNGGLYVSDDYFSILGVQAVVGRTFTPADGQPVAVISYSYWERRFGRDSSVVGKSIDVNAHPVTIIGVEPRNFYGISVGRSPDVIVPLRMYPQLNPSPAQFNSPGNWWLEGMGRLKPDVGATQATADLNVVFQQYMTQAAISKQYGSWRIALEPGWRGASAMSKFGADTFVAALMAVVGLVLVIACANVANLLLARNTARQKEIALRLSLGSSRGRLIRQLLTESVVLAIIGGAVAVLLASLGCQSLKLLLPPATVVDLAPDARVLVFTAVASIVTALLCGLGPAFRAARADFTPALKESSGHLAVGPFRNRVRSGLVIFQVALSLVLLVLAGLFTHSFQNLTHVALGFQPEHVLVMSVDPTLIGYNEDRIAALYQVLLEQLEATPGVQSASLSQTGLMGGGLWENLVSIPGYRPRPGEDMGSSFSPVGAHFFQTTGIPILFGRDFTTRDNQTAPKVAIVNEEFAKDFFPAESPMGRTIGLGPNQNLGQFQIVGVVKGSKQRRLNEPPARSVYFPFLQLPPQQMGRVMLEVRTGGDPAAMIATARLRVLAVEKKLPVFREKTLTQVVENSTLDQRMMTALAALFGGLALSLACMGLSGVTSFSVARRTGEIGIRMALGAERGDVAAMVLREAIALVSIGVAIGLPLSLVAGRVVSSQLFGITGTDPLAVSGATALLFATAALASYVPARRASRVDPMVALRHE